MRILYDDDGVLVCANTDTVEFNKDTMELSFTPIDSPDEVVMSLTGEGDVDEIMRHLAKAGYLDLTGGGTCA